MLAKINCSTIHQMSVQIHTIYLLSDNNIIPGESLVIIFFTKNKHKKETSYKTIHKLYYQSLCHVKPHNNRYKVLK